MQSHRFRLRLAQSFAVSVVVVAVVLLVLLSPALLIVVDHYWRADWPRLSNTGQTYGIASAIFSALAIVGVVASLLYQALQVRAQVVQTSRQAHTDLLRMVISDPDLYADCVGTWPEDMPNDTKRRSIFLALWLQYALTGFRSGTISEANLRSEILPDMFSKRPAREFWEWARNYWRGLEGTGRRRDGAFFRMIEEEYQRAIDNDQEALQDFAIVPSAVDPPSR